MILYRFEWKENRHTKIRYREIHQAIYIKSIRYKNPPAITRGDLIFSYAETISLIFINLLKVERSCSSSFMLI